MFNKFVRLVFVPLVILTLASVAQAQMGGSADMGSNRPVSFGIGGGVSVPVSDASDAFDTGFNGQGFVRFNLPQFPIQPRVPKRHHWPTWQGIRRALHGRGPIWSPARPRWPGSTSAACSWSRCLFQR